MGFARANGERSGERIELTYPCNNPGRIYISRKHCFMEEFPEVFQQQRKRLLNYRPKPPRSRYSEVSKTFKASVSMLEASQSLDAKDALCLLEVLSMLDFNNFPKQILVLHGKDFTKFAFAIKSRYMKL